MIVYHLKGYVYTNGFGNLCEKYSHFSDVFTTLELAMETGKREIEERVQRFFKQQTVFTADEFEDFMKEEIEYAFQVIEFDPERRQQGTVREDWENCTFENAVEYSHEIEWDFDRQGNLLSRCEWRGVGHDVRPSDYSDDAGTHFKLGDFVVPKNPASFMFEGDGNDDGIYVVAGAPGRRKERRFPLSWENIYCLYYSSGGEYPGGHHHIHESDLQVCSKEVPVDSFLHVLSKYFKGEPINESIAERIESGEPIFVGDLKWHYKFMDGSQTGKGEL